MTTKREKIESYSYMLGQRSIIATIASVGFLYLIICPTLSALGTKCPMPNQFIVSKSHQQDKLPDCHSKEKSTKTKADPTDCCDGKESQITTSLKTAFDHFQICHLLESDHFSSYSVDFKDIPSNSFYNFQAIHLKILSSSFSNSTPVLLI